MNPKIADVIARVKYELECTEQFVSESIPVNRQDIAALMAEIDKLQAAQPSAVVVDEAMVERGLQGAIGASDARLARYSVVRAILESALTAQGEG